MRAVVRVPLIVLNGVVVLSTLGYGAVVAFAGPPGGFSSTTLPVLCVICIPHVSAAWAVLGNRRGCNAGMALALNGAWLAALVAVGGVAATGIAGLVALLVLVIPLAALAGLNTAVAVRLMLKESYRDEDLARPT